MCHGMVKTAHNNPAYFSPEIILQAIIFFIICPVNSSQAKPGQAKPGQAIVAGYLPGSLKNNRKVKVSKIFIL